tara:strand:+ start:1617 stop:1766 length:150 start_codon:yes stop_codon:yes gene_type:complete
MGKEYYREYYKKNKAKIKEQSKNNYNKKSGKSSSIPVEFKQGQFIICFD